MKDIINIRGLGNGDEITWIDPDNGICSRTGTIKAIEWAGDIAYITFDDDSYLEAYEHELK